MTFNPNEKAEIQALIKQYPVIKKLHEAYLAEDPTRELRNQAALMLTHISQEMEWLREGKIEKLKILNSDEKLFERVNTILVNIDKYAGNLDRLMQSIEPEDKNEPKTALKGKKKTEDVRLPV